MCRVFKLGDTCWDSSSPPRRGVLITANTKGAVVPHRDLKGVMMEASAQEPQEGSLLVVIPCYLCRGHGGQLEPLALPYTLLLVADSCSRLHSPVCPWELDGMREANSGGVFAQARRHTPSISPHSQEETQSFLLPAGPFSPHPSGAYWSSLGPAQI